MSGIYLHIPFCKQACHYCNFHFSTSLKLREPLVNALVKELEMQQPFLGGHSLRSIYFGGGTPSLLQADELQHIFDTIKKLHQIEADAEITLEANPDDVTQENLAIWRDSPINRLSIGIQSFHEHDLKFMNRAHTAREARQCVDLARAAGFDLLTIDLIYGSPTTTDADWAENLKIFRQLELPHLSSYALTVEPNTALNHFVEKGKVAPPDDEKAARQFAYLQEKMTEWGYEQYEVSNFALPGRYAVHNTAYWSGVPYLGIGPAAHSYKPGLRQWNVANNPKYIRAIEAGVIPSEREELSTDDMYNELVLTRLRTQWGVRYDALRGMGPEYIAHFQREAKPLIAANKLQYVDGAYIIPPAARFFADGIAADLFI